MPTTVEGLDHISMYVTITEMIDLPNLNQPSSEAATEYGIRIATDYLSAVVSLLN